MKAIAQVGSGTGRSFFSLQGKPFSHLSFINQEEKRIGQILEYSLHIVS